ncbi:hypothetical protein D3C86_1618250 [compost metagenome]
MSRAVEGDELPCRRATIVLGRGQEAGGGPRLLAPRDGVDADVGNGDADLADRIHRGIGEGQGHLGILLSVVVTAATTGGQQGGQGYQG